MYVAQLQSTEWVQKLAFAEDRTDQLKYLCRMLQARNIIVAQYYDNMRAFKSMHTLWEMQLSNNNLAHCGGADV